MEKLLLINIIILGFFFSLRSQPNVSFNSDVVGTTVHFTPIINIPNITNYSCHWDFGNGTSSDEPSPTCDYRGYGTYHVTLTFVWSGIGLNSYDNYASYDVPGWVTIAPPQINLVETSALNPKITLSKTSFAVNENVEINCSIAPGFQDRTINWELYINGNKVEGDVIQNSGAHTFSRKFSTGAYSLQLRVSDAAHLDIFASSMPVTIMVENSGSSENHDAGCCFSADIYRSGNNYTRSDATFIEQGSNADYTLSINLNPYCSGENSWICENLTNQDYYNYIAEWTVSSTNQPLGTNYIGQLRQDYFSKTLQLNNLSPGKYLIKCKVYPLDPSDPGIVNGRYKEAFSEITIKPTLKLKKGADEISEISLHIDGGTETIKIEGTNNSYPSDGNILVDGDWIKIERFNTQELVFSCEPSTTEDRKGRIIVSFPETFSSKTIYVHQSRSTWIVSDNQTLSKAVNNSEDGSTIILNPGTYKVPLNIKGKNITLASKFLTTGDPYYIDKTIIDANGQGSAVKIEGYSNTGGSVKLIGFHIKGGNATEGGGIYCSNTKVELQNVLIHGNYGGSGGGIYCNNSVLNGNHITIAHNDAAATAEYKNARKGHAAYLCNGSKLTLKNSIIGGILSDNYGGGVYFDRNSPPSACSLDKSFLDGIDQFPAASIGVINIGPSQFSYHDLVCYLIGQMAEVYEDWQKEVFWVDPESVCSRADYEGKDIGALYNTYKVINTQVIDVTPKTLSFNRIILGNNEQTLSVEVKNISELNVTAISAITDFKNDYRVVPSELNIKPGETKRLYVIFNPQTLGDKTTKIKIRTRSSTDVREVNINGNCVSKPDLVGEIANNNFEFKSGRYLNTLSYAVRNNGGSVSRASIVKYYFSTIPMYSENAVLLGQQQINILQPGEKQDLPSDLISIPQATSTGTYYLIAVVDANKNVDESNETNNQLVKAINVIHENPALTVDNVLFLDPKYGFKIFDIPGALAGDPVKVSFRVNNTSDETVGFTVKIYLSDNITYETSDPELASLGNLNIGANSSQNLLQTLQIPGDAVPGGKFMLFKAYEQDIPETNPNIKVTSVDFEVLRLPDYNISWTPTLLNSFYPGDEVPFDFTINNLSNSSAPATKVGYYLSSDPNYDISDIKIAESPIPQISLQNPSLIISDKITLPQGISPGTWYIILRADPDNLIEESNETNNDNYIKLQVNAYPDLAASNFQLSTNTVLSGTSVFASIKIKNIGYGNAPQSKLKFYLSADNIIDATNDLELGEILINPLASNEEFNLNSFELSIPFEAGGGNWYIFAKADGEILCPNAWCDIKESNEENNLVSSQINVWRKPDLYFQSTSLTQGGGTIYSAVKGTNVNFAYDIWHSNGNMLGNGKPSSLSYAGPNKLKCYLSSSNVLDQNNAVLLGTKYISGTFGDNVISDNLTFSIPETISAGNWYFFAVIDAENAINERDENNNVWTQALTIADKPDLAILSLAVEPAVAIRGVTNTLSFKSFIKNISPISLIDIASVKYYVSSDNILSADDILIKDTEVDLSNDFSNEGWSNYSIDWENENWSKNLSYGTYYIICQTFPSDHIDENNANNNIAVVPFEIKQSVDLEISNLTLDHSVIEEGTSFSVSCTIKNNNTTTSSPCTLNLNLDVVDINKFSNSNLKYDLETINIPSLGQGESVNISRVYNVPFGTIAYYLNAICDVNNQNTESNKENNLASVPIIIQPYSSPISLNLNITNATINGSNNGHVECTVSGGISPYNFVWYRNGILYSTEQLLQHAQAGDYVVTVSDNHGNSTTERFYVTEPNILLSTVNVIQHVSTHDGNDGVIGINIQNGNPPYHIYCMNGYSGIWPIGQSTGTISGLSPGNYLIEITEDNTAVNGNRNTYNITINNQIDIAYSANNVSQYGANNGSINIVNLDGAIGPYSFSWTKNNIEISKERNLTNLSPGTYRLTVLDNIGSSKSIDIPITQPQELTVNYVVTNVSVTGQSTGAINLTVNGNPPYSYNWSNGSTQEDLNNIPSGEYRVTVTDAFQSVTKYITVNQPFYVNVFYLKNVSTPGGSDGKIMCTGAGGYYSYTYTWYKDGVLYSSGSNQISNISKGEYKVNVVDYNGSVATKTIIITEPKPLAGTISPVDVSTYNGSDGAVDINIQSGNPPYKIQWNNSTEIWPIEKTSGRLTGFSPSDILFQVTDNSGQQIAQTITINNHIEIVSFIATNVSSFGGNNGYISINPLEGVLPYVYSWKKDGISFTGVKELTNLTAGVYNVTVTDNIGNSASKSITITQPNELVLSYKVKNASNEDTKDGIIDLTVENGNPPYTFTWKSAQSSSISSNEDLINVSPGIYYVSVQDGKGQIKGTPWIKVQPLKVSLIVKQITKHGANNGSILTQISSLSSTVEWIYNDTFYSNSNEITNLKPGKYTVNAIDINGLTNSKTIIITEPDVLTVDQIVTDATSYNGADGAIDLTVTGGIPPFTYTLAKNGTVVSSQEDTKGLTAGTYQLRVTDGYSIVDKYVEVRNPLTILGGNKTNNTTIGGSSGQINSYCYGGNQPINLVVYKNGIEYYSRPNYISGSLVNLANLSSGEYTLIFTDINNKTASKTQFITDPVSVQIASNPLSGPETSDANATLTVSGGLPPYSYQWKKDNVNFSNASNLTNLASGTYTLLITDVEGRTASSVLPISPYMPTATISGGGEICNDGSVAVIDINLSGRSPWSLVLQNGTNTYNLNNITSSHYQYTTQTPGTYTISEGNDNLYLINNKIGSAVVQLNQIPTATISGGGSLCQLDGRATIKFDLTGEGPWDINYTNGTLVYGLTGITSNHYEVQTSLSGIYTISSVHDANCTGTSSGQAEVIYTSVPVATVTGGYGICENGGTAKVNVGLTGTAPWNFTYTDGTNSHSLNNITAPNYEIITSVPGTYYVTQISDATGCPGNSINMVDVNINHLPTATAGGGGAICQNESANVSVLLTGTAPWNITYSDGVNSKAVTTWSNQYNFKAFVQGTYIITSLSDANCPGTSLGLGADVTVHQLPHIDLGIDKIIGAGETLSLDAGTGYSYLWTPDLSTSQIKNVSEPEKYSVKITDQNNCSNTDEINISKLDLGENKSYCQGSSLEIDAGDGFASYLWNNGTTSRYLDVSTPGSYSVQVTNEQGYTKTDAILITENPKPNIDLGPDMVINFGQSVTLDPGPGYSYLWDNGSTMQQRVINAPGNYSVLASTGNGCISIDNVKVTQLISEPAITFNKITWNGVEFQFGLIDGIENYEIRYYENGTSNYYSSTISSSPHVLTDLKPNTAYNLQIRSKANGLAQTPWGNVNVYNFSTLNLSDYNFKEGALELIELDNWCSSGGQFQNTNATGDGPTPSCWSQPADHNVWFKFTAQNQYQRITVKTSGNYGSMFGQQIALWDAMGNPITCAESNDLEYGTLSVGAENLVIGQTYYISVDDRSVPGTFAICMSTQKDYNFKEGAIELTANDGCSADDQFDNRWTTGDGTAGTCWSQPADHNVWFKFTAQNQYQRITVKTSGNYGSMFGQQIALWDAMGNPITCAESNDLEYGTLSVGAENLVIGQTYYISVDDRSVPGTFAICMSTQKDYNFKEGAIELTANDGCSADDQFDNRWTTGDGTAGTCWSQPADHNVWFKFTAQNQYQRITVKTSGNYGSMFGQQIALWDAMGNPITCAESNDLEYGTLSVGAENLVIGQTYYISVDDRSVPGTFAICMSTQKDYNFKEGAIELTANDGCSADDQFDNRWTTGDGTAGTCWSQPADHNVWFKFTAQNQYQRITVKTSGNYGSMFGQQIALWDAMGNPITCAESNDLEYGTLSVGAENLVIGQTYYISVDDRSVPGTFAICMSTQKDYNFKEGAIELTANDGCSADDQFDNRWTTGDGTAGTCWSQPADHNVWFKFTAQNQYQRITVKTSGNYGSMFGQQIAVWDAMGNPITCAESNDLEYGTLSVGAENLVIGQTYYISVDDRSVPGTFAICMSTQKDYNFKEGAIELTNSDNWCSSEQQFSNKFTTGDQQAGSCWTNGPDHNVWFKFTAQSQFEKICVKTEDEYGTMRGPQIAVWNSSGAEIACVESESWYQGPLPLNLVGLEAGQTYYISVDDKGNQGSFTLCMNQQKDFSYKAGAVELSQLDNWCSSDGQYQNSYAVGDEEAGSCWTGGANNDVWFRFTARNKFQKFTIKTGDDYGYMYAQQMALWNSSGVEVACAEMEGWGQGSISMDADGLVVGQVYYLAVDDKNGAGTFTLCIDTLKDYNFRAGAFELTNPNNWCSAEQQFSNTFATGDQQGGSCWTQGPDHNVWFKFTAQNQFAKISVKTGGDDGTMYGPQIALWNSSGEEVACVESEDWFQGTLPLDVVSLQSGQTYYISVDDKNLPGTFTLCIDTLKDYNYKEAALEMTNLDNWCSTDAQFQNTYATADQQAGSCWTEGPAHNVWFKFTAQNQLAKIILKTGDANGTIYGPQIAVWNSSGAEIACVESENWYQGILPLDVTGLQAGQTYYISIDAQNLPGTFTLCISNQPTRWIGAVSSEWNNINNWNPAQVPTANDNIVIPNSSSTNFNPLISSTAETNTITIESGGLLTVGAGGALTAHGNLTNNGTLLISSPSDNGMTGSFIDNGNISGAGKVQVERYIISHQSHYVSVPINGGNAYSNLFTSFGSSFNPNLYAYNESYDIDNNPNTAPAGPYKPVTVTWVFVQRWATDPIVPLLPTMGYSFNTDLDGKITFNADLSKGDQLNTGDLSVTGLSYTNNDPFVSTVINETYDGWHLVGNPYPSCIDWNLINQGLTNLDNAIYVWDKTQYSNYINGISGGAGNQNNFIAPMQGFMVHATANNAGFTLNNSHRVHSLSTKFKNAISNEEPKKLISLRLSANGKSDIAVVYFETDATEEFDGKYDAFRFFSWDNNPDNSENIGVPHLFSITPEQRTLTINALPDVLLGETVVPLGIRLGTIGQYTISREQLNIPGFNVYLTDKQENKTICLNNVNSYTFNYMGGDNRKRFKLIFKSQQEDGKDKMIEQSTSDINIYPNPSKGKFFITTSQPDKIKKIDVYDLSGNLITNLQNIQKFPVEIDLSGMARGTYIIVISEDKLVREFRVVKD